MKKAMNNNNSDAYTSPNMEIFRDAYNAVKSFHFDNISELEESHPVEWKNYTDSVRAIIGDIMKSTRNIYHGNKRTNIYISNAGMVKSLRTSGFKFYSKTDRSVSDEITDEIFSHIILNSMYFLNRADNAKGAYLLINRSVSNRLVNMTHQMNRWLRDYPVRDISSLSEIEESIITELMNYTETEDEIVNRHAVEDIREKFIHAAIKKLAAHPDRMLTYLASYLELPADELCQNVKDYDYPYVLSFIIEGFQKLHIDLSYLRDKELRFKKPHNTIDRQDIYNWKMRAMNDLKPLLAEFAEHHSES